MNETLKAVKISDHVYWVGAIDWTIRDFHGYSTSRGTTYNAYLVLGEKITLIDTVKSSFGEEMLSRISSVVDPTSIDVIISNHSEMDHTGCLPEMIMMARPERVYASAMGAKALEDHFGLTEEITTVKDGETIAIGDLHFTFTETRMLHWPDSMFTTLEEDGIVFSQDAFGMHLASFERYADEISPETIAYETAKYYANILMPFSSRIAKLLEKLRKSNFAPRMIAPDHGPIWRKDLGGILERYENWSARVVRRKAVVVYDTMWQSTERMALAISEGLASQGVEVKIMPLKVAHRSDVATEVLEAGALFIGSPTLNDQLFPTVADIVSYLKGLKPAHMVGSVFGSHGWSGAAVDELKAAYAAMKIEMIGDGLKVRYVPDDQALNEAYALGVQAASRLPE